MILVKCKITAINLRHILKVTMSDLKWLHWTFFPSQYFSAAQKSNNTKLLLHPTALERVYIHQYMQIMSQLSAVYPNNLPSSPDREPQSLRII